MTGQPSADGSHWDPNQYARYTDHRLRPALELMDHIAIVRPEVIYDLGCGPGNVTGHLAARWPQAEITGVDHSREMLDQARNTHDGIVWREGDISTWTPDAPADLIYSNATLHWLDGHADLLPRLLDSVKPGGALAVQMPKSWEAPSHALMRSTLDDGGIGGTPIGPADLRASLARNWVLDKTSYYDFLVNRCRNLDIWETEYLQVLNGEDAVLEWVKATGLRPILDTLAGEDLDTFLALYRRRLAEAYPQRADGTTLYPFRRLFFVAAL